jgi:hypothetical protein
MTTAIQRFERRQQDRERRLREMVKDGYRILDRETGEFVVEITEKPDELFVVTGAGARELGTYKSVEIAFDRAAAELHRYTRVSVRPHRKNQHSLADWRSAFVRCFSKTNASKE